MNTENSFAPLDAGRVARACQGYLAARERRIATQRAALIDAEMARKWFRPKSRAEAEEKLKRKAFGEYERIWVRGLHWASKIETLLSLAKAANGGQVFVVAEDAETLGEFLTPNDQAKGPATARSADGDGPA